MRALLCLCICLSTAARAFPADGDSLLVSDQNVVAAEIKVKTVNVARREYEKWRGDGVLRETDSAAVRYEQAYWEIVGRKYTRKEMRSQRWQDDHPWSAAFISFVLKEAGAGGQFPYAETHSNYIVWARENAKNKQAALYAAYSTCDTAAAWPQPGDLLCKNRDGMRYTLAGLRAGNISHCDIVVEVDTLNRCLYTIGGNLNNSVTRRMICLDENGFIDRTANWQLLDEPLLARSGSQDEFFAVVKLNDSFVRAAFLVKKD